MIENTSLYLIDFFLSDNRRQIVDGGFGRIVISPYIVGFLQILLAMTLAIRERLKILLEAASK